jgi:hypothetical protein
MQHRANNSNGNNNTDEDNANNNNNITDVATHGMDKP